MTPVVGHANKLSGHPHPPTRSLAREPRCRRRPHPPRVRTADARCALTNTKRRLPDMSQGTVLQLAVTAAFCLSPVGAQEPADQSASDPARQRLQLILPTKSDLEKFLRGKQGPEQLARNSGKVFDADL